MAQITCCLCGAVLKWNELNNENRIIPKSRNVLCNVCYSKKMTLLGKVKCLPEQYGDYVNYFDEKRRTVIDPTLQYELDQIIEQGKQYVAEKQAKQHADQTIILSKEGEKMSLLFCPGCGKQISGNAAFCVGCGYDLNKYIQKKQAENALTQQNTAPFSFPYENGSMCEVCGYAVDKLVPKCPNCKDGGRMVPMKKTVVDTPKVEKPTPTLSSNAHIIEPVRNKALQHLEDDLICEVKGVRGRTMKLYPYKVMIRVDATVGSVLTANVFDGEKTIYFKDCIGIQFKKSGATIGYLQFETAAPTTNNEKSNFFNENSFTFEGNNDYMQKVYEYVIGRMDEVKGAY